MSCRFDIIIPFRNRELLRVTQLVKSFRTSHLSNKVEMNFYVSNYGTTRPNFDELEHLCVTENISVVHSYTQGLPWNRAHAINNGVRHSSSDWLCIVDVDMVLLDPVLEDISSNLVVPNVYFLESIWLQSPRQSWMKGIRHRSYGVFQVIHRSWFEKLHGLDERMEFWGLEDSDWVGRLLQAGARLIWLSADQYRLVHMWHPWQNNPINRPRTAEWRSLSFQIQNLIQNYCNPEWGKILKKDDRPILALINQKDPLKRYILDNSNFVDLVPEILKDLKAAHFIEISWGPRRIKRKLMHLDFWRSWFLRLSEATSLEIQPLVNLKLEEFLLAKDLLNDYLSDYYLKEDLSGVWLLGKS